MGKKAGLNSLMRIRDRKNSDPGWKKCGSGIRDKHPGSATLILLYNTNAGMSRLVFPGQVLQVPPAPPPAPPPHRKPPPDDMEVIEYQVIKVNSNNLFQLQT
jgi:hypothetical protein